MNVKCSIMKNFFSIVISLCFLILGSCSQAPHWMDMSNEVITPEGRSLTQGESIELFFETEEFVPDGVPIRASVVLMHNEINCVHVEETILMGLEKPKESGSYRYEFEKGEGKHSLRLQFPLQESGEWCFFVWVNAAESPQGWTSWRREYQKRLIFTVLPNE